MAAPVGIWIEYIKFAHAIAPLRLLIATIGFGTLLVLTTGIGFFMVRRRNIRVHRMWMTRSYAVAIVFLESRFVDQIPWLAKLWERPATILKRTTFLIFGSGSCSLLPRLNSWLGARSF